MSADNWKECPNCESRKADEELEARSALAAVYGKVPADEYLRRQKALVDLEKRQLEETLREDYEFHFDTTAMELNIYYKCHCDCGFNFSHEDTVLVPSGPADREQ